MASGRCMAIRLCGGFCRSTISVEMNNAMILPARLHAGRVQIHVWREQVFIVVFDPMMDDGCCIDCKGRLRRWSLVILAIETSIGQKDNVSQAW